MRCTGSPCQGTYYWRDPDNRKHYKLNTSVLPNHIYYAEGGNILRTLYQVHYKKPFRLHVAVRNSN
ncbi:hypothetical protein QC762_207935 [Podospora pseudocomata]|uniref:Uncharacterized protein n=1 Tax=Podospora pseudocomata TaxID=2093779 RepID=A0ABR0GM94_9PEZI|nr:hypothetical protein QC762_207935 [Podospora pseudocomata]